MNFDQIRDQRYNYYRMGARRSRAWEVYHCLFVNIKIIFEDYTEHSVGQGVSLESGELF